MSLAVLFLPGSSNKNITDSSKNMTERLFIPQSIFYNFNMTCPVEDEDNVIITDNPQVKVTVPSTTPHTDGESSVRQEAAPWQTLKLIEYHWLISSN